MNEKYNPIYDLIYNALNRPSSLQAIHAKPNLKRYTKEELLAGLNELIDQHRIIARPASKNAPQKTTIYEQVNIQ